MVSLSKEATMTELKPCPFCGGKAYFERMGTGRQSCIVECGNCGVRHESSDEYEMSGTSWNDRHEPKSAAPAPNAATTTAKSVATVCVTHKGYGMELSTHVAYALPEGLHDLYATPPAEHWLRAWIDERRRLSLNPELHAHETANINLFLDELEKAWRSHD